jgi:molybdate transport system ATP-binding protein
MLHVEATLHLGTFRLDVSFRTEHRRVVLFGPSGAGKSLTLQCVAGFAVPERGHIEIDGTVLFDSATRTNIPPWQRRVGLVLQAYTLFPHLTVAENVAYGLAPVWKGREPVRVATLLAAVGLEGYMDRMPSQLSGGQRQRVALAQALATDPRILALDEPFSAVDAPVRERLRRDLLELLDAFRVPLLFVTHDFGEAYLLGETVVILSAGRVVQVGSPEEVARHPRTATVARLVGAANVLEGEVLDSQDGWVVLRAGPLTLRTGGPALPRGARVPVCVRPEDVQILPEGPPWPRARVTRVLTRHGAATVVLSVQGLALEASVAPAPPLGASVGVRVPDGAAQVLEPDDEEGGGRP